MNQTDEQTPAKLAIMLSGFGSNFQAILNAINEGYLPAEVVVVVSNRQAAYGLQRAKDAGIPTIYHPFKPYRTRKQGRQAYDKALADFIHPYQPDYIVMVGWMRLLSCAFLDQYPNQVINLHPALPGQFPGTHAIQDAFEAHQRGEITQTGVMVHLVPDERVDEGPVLGTATVSIYENDTLETLKSRIHATEHRLLIETLREVLMG